eukprot:3584255-Rhodomonas_salina.1
MRVSALGCCALRALVDVLTRDTIARIPRVARAREAAIRISAHCLRMAVMPSLSALVGIYTHHSLRAARHLVRHVDHRAQIPALARAVVNLAGRFDCHRN